jgi:acetyltransferase
VNSKRASVLGIRAYTSISAAPKRVDLAVVVIPAESVPGNARLCRCRSRTPKIISAGFRETGARGLELEVKTLEAARQRGIRLIRPNCHDVMRPASGSNATFAPGMVQPGSVALISQRAERSALLCSIRACRNR